MKVVARNSASCAGGLAQADRLASAVASTAAAQPRQGGSGIGHQCSLYGKGGVCYPTRASRGASLAATLGRHDDEVGEVVLPAVPFILQMGVHAGAFLRLIKRVRAGQQKMGDGAQGGRVGVDGHVGAAFAAVLTASSCR